MKINNINSQNCQSFNVYKNVLTNRIFLNNSDVVTYMSMQLNNIGSKDLEVWEFLQKNLLLRKKLSNIITFANMEIDGKTVFAFPEMDLMLDRVKKSSYLEKLMLKSVTLIASLTKKIKDDFNNQFDEHYVKMARTIRNDLYSIVFGEGTEYNEVERSIFEAYFNSASNPQKLASEMNEEIADKMIKYFE